MGSTQRLRRFDGDELGGIILRATRPRRQGGGRDQEAPGRELERPAARCAQLKDGHALGRRVVRSLAWRDPAETSSQDAKLLIQRAYLGPKPLRLRLQPHAADAGVRAPSANVGHAEMGKAERLEHGGPDVFWPIARERSVTRPPARRGSSAPLRIAGLTKEWRGAERARNAVARRHLRAEERAGIIAARGADRRPAQ